ncbi:hypothetical protein [Bifidobacterium sp. SO4]|uniref:hypothetical protein n=1 Tax=Bifidobacterium sp. SO4 TaxID=2809030 RepID=UPI001BDBF20C|nr:hypothetical protein [Bifidobacterium sp. SO4]MBT1171634.1 hypothetical protein [Bifidobacterium sp. SO4]
MNTYLNASLRNQSCPAPTNDGVIPLFSICRCLLFIQSGRDCVAQQYASATTSVENAASAIARSKDIEWTGNAAEWFRSTLDRTAYTIRMLADDMETTQRLSMGA